MWRQPSRVRGCAACSSWRPCRRARPYRPQNVNAPLHTGREPVRNARHGDGRIATIAGSRHRAITARADDVARAAQQSADPAAMRLRAHRTGMHRPTSTCSGAASASAMGGILLQNSPRSAEVAQPSRKRSCCPIASLAQWSPPPDVSLRRSEPDASGQ